jgi:chromosome segregation ATPase
MRETSTPVDILDDPNVGDGEVAQWILPLIFPELNARTLQEKGDQHLLHDNVARLAGNLQAVASNVTAYSEALQTQWRAIAALAKGQGQATSDMRELRALVESVIEGVTDVAREQAAVRGIVQEGMKAMSGTTEAVGQGQRNLQAEVEKVTEAARQALAALTATAAEQTAVHETVRHVMDAVTGVAARQTALGEAVQAHEQASAAWAGRQEQLASDIRRVHDLTQTVVGGIGDVVREQAATRGAMQESARVMGTAAEAIGQGQRNLQAEVQKMVETTRQAVTDLAATAADQAAARETVRRMSEEVTGIAARQTALHQTVQAHEQASAAATAALTGSVADVAREQAAARSAWQDSVKVMGASTEAVQQSLTTLRLEMEKMADTARQSLAVLTASAAEQTAVHETVRHVGEEVTGVAARQTALGEAVQAHEQASAAAVAMLVGRQEQLAGDVRQLHELTRTVADGVAEGAREQAAVRGAVQDSAKVLSATAEAVQQGQRTLQSELERITGVAQQTSAALTAAAAEQTAVHETIRRASEQVAGLAAGQTALREAVQIHEQATAALTGRQEQLAGDVRQLHELTQTVAGGVTDVAREQAAVRSAVQDSATGLSATAETVQQGQRNLQIEMEKIVETARQTSAALTTTAAEQTAVHEAVRRVMEEVTGVGARQIALHEAVQAHGQTLTGAAAEQAAVHETVRRVKEEMTGVAVRQTALQEAVQASAAAAAALAGRQEQLAGDVRRLQELTQMVAGGVADVAREQAAVRSAVQDSAQGLSATTGAVQQGQRALETAMEKLVDATRQTMAALMTTAAEQNTGQEITRRMIGEVANAARAALAAGHGRLTDAIPQPQVSAQTVADLGPREIKALMPAAEGDTPLRLSAAEAITHGEQIRYEIGPDRDNLGFWTNASDWAQWEFEVKRPGRFRIMAQIAALAPARFQVVFADQKLEANAPNTGDYGRFQQVELGSVELTSSGKTRVAVRPIPEGWQPMNLKTLDLVPLP